MASDEIAQASAAGVSVKRVRTERARTGRVSVMGIRRLALWSMPKDVSGGIPGTLGTRGAVWPKMGLPGATCSDAIAKTLLRRHSRYGSIVFDERS